MQRRFFFALGAAILLALFLLSPAAAATYKTVTLNGSISDAEWGTESNLGTAGGTTFRITWDDDFWYFGVAGGMGDGDFFMVGIDSDPLTESSSNTGGTAERCGATFPTENKPNYIAVLRQNSYIRESWGWNGSSWAQSSWNPAETADFDFSGSSSAYEVKIRKTAVFGTNPDTTPVGFYLWLSNGSCQFFNAWPPENANGFVAGSRFLYAHTRFENTDANRDPNTYGSRVGWDSNTLSSTGTVNYFGEDDESTNPWLRLVVNTAGGGSCTMRAKVVGVNAFPQPFTGMNRFIEFTPTNCTNLNVDVRMRYEDSELNGVTEGSIVFYRCPAFPCTWTAVVGGTYTRDATNNHVTLTNVAQTQFSFWTMASSPPTVVTLADLSTRLSPIPLAAIVLFLALAAGTLLAVWRRRVAQ
jgi:hypothetical protein